MMHPVCIIMGNSSKAGIFPINSQNKIQVISCICIQLNCNKYCSKHLRIIITERFAGEKYLPFIVDKLQIKEILTTFITHFMYNVSMIDILFINKI